MREMKHRKLLARLTSGALQNVNFRDLTALVRAFGFQLARVNGSHHIFGRPDVPHLVNLQDANGEAKPYQIRQFLRIVERYNLKLEEKHE